MDFAQLNQRPIVVAIAGPNGAGKSTFFRSQIAFAGMRFVNADVIARQFRMEPYAAARLANALRRELLSNGESFAFETVFSDPVGDKLEFLGDAARGGFQVLLCFIGLNSAEQSAERVAMRVSSGGHDVPAEKLRSRFPRILANLQAAITRLPNVVIYDNGNLAVPFRQVAVFQQGQLRQLNEPIPHWLRDIMP